MPTTINNNISSDCSHVRINNCPKSCPIKSTPPPPVHRHLFCAIMQIATLLSTRLYTSMTLFQQTIYLFCQNEKWNSAVFLSCTTMRDNGFESVQPSWNFEGSETKFCWTIKLCNSRCIKNRCKTEQCRKKLQFHFKMCPFFSARLFTFIVHAFFVGFLFEEKSSTHVLHM